MNTPRRTRTPQRYDIEKRRWNEPAAPPTVVKRRLRPRERGAASASPADQPPMLNTRAIAAAQERYFAELDAKHRQRTRAVRLDELS